MILVTGATGHIGNVLVRQLLARGRRVRALVWRGEDGAPLRDLAVDIVRGDVLDPDSLRPALEGVEVVYHLAGMISILPGEQPLMRRVNVEGTRNVLAAARAAGVRRLVYTSSIHALQRLPRGVIDERVPFDPHTPYGAYDQSKAQATLDVLAAARAGLDAVVVCPTGVIGPYDHLGSELGAVIRSAVQGRTQWYVSGAYDFVDVRDVAEGLQRAAARGARGETYILSGQRLSIQALLLMLQRISGRRFPLRRVPYRLAWQAALPLAAWQRWRSRPPRFTRYSLEVLRSNARISHARASRELGYRPRPLYASLVDAVAWLTGAPTPVF